jgi:hypothetical protein
MKVLIRVAVVISFLVPALVSAQEPQVQHPLAGYWSVVMAQGEDEVVIELRVGGDVVTGPIGTTGRADLYIRNGSVTANSVHFTSPSLKDDDGPALVWTGQLTGENELAFSVAPEGAESLVREFVATKRPVPGGK